MAEDHPGGFAHSRVPILHRGFEGRFDRGIIEGGQGHDATAADLRWPTHDEVEKHGNRSSVADRPQCSHRRFLDETIFGIGGLLDEPRDRIGVPDLAVRRGYRFDNDGIGVPASLIQCLDRRTTGVPKHFRRFRTNPGLGISREDMSDRRNEFGRSASTRRQCKPPQLCLRVPEERNRILQQCSEVATRIVHTLRSRLSTLDSRLSTHDPRPATRDPPSLSNNIAIP